MNIFKAIRLGSSRVKRGDKVIEAEKVSQLIDFMSCGIINKEDLEATDWEAEFSYLVPEYVLSKWTEQYTEDKLNGADVSQYKEVVMVER
jgi:hypothetical protein